MRWIFTIQPLVFGQQRLFLNRDIALGQPHLAAKLFLRGDTMAETTEATPVVNSRRIVEEYVEFARRNGASARATLRLDGSS